MSVMTKPKPTGPLEPEGETRIAVRGVPWSVYELWVDALPERSGIRMAYDGEDLEIMTKGPKHEDFRELLGRIVTEVAVELNIPQKCLGETTWKRPELSRGLEADQCYYFQPEKLAAAARAKARGSNDVADYPTRTWPSRSTSHPRWWTDRVSIRSSGSPRSGDSMARP